MLDSNSEMKEERFHGGQVRLFNSLASDYDAWFEDAGRLIFDIEVRAFQEVLSSLPKPWLEVGVGSGRFARALGIEVGLDPSIRLAEIAKRRGIEVLLGVAEQPPFRERAFGTLFLIVTLCFVTSPLDVLAESRRVLVPGGKIVLGLVLRDSPCGQFYEEKKKRGHRYYKHATFYSFAEVSGFLEEAGFSVEKVISTLFQKPGEVERAELPCEGFFPDAGFTIIVAEKPA